MGIPSTGNISIKSAAGSGRSIDAEVTATSSGSLVTLSTNSINHTGGRATAVTNDTDASPYSILEFAGYSHTWSTTGTVDEITIGKTVRYELDLVDQSPDNVGGIIKDDGVLTYPGGLGLRIMWGPTGAETLNTNWTSVKIGATEGSATTINRSSFTTSTGSSHAYHLLNDGGSYITNTDGATMYFSFIA